jgi:hypothetical protein
MSENYNIYEGLSPTQLKHLESVEWLLDDGNEYRRTGRTHLMARIFINKSLQSGNYVYLQNHDIIPSLPLASSEIIKEVEKIVNLFPDLVLTIKVYAGRRTSIKVSKKENTEGEEND